MPALVNLGSLLPMRIDASQLHAELSIAVASLGDGPGNAPDAGALWNLGRLLFRPPLKTYTDEVRQRLFRPIHDIEQRLQLAVRQDLLLDVQTLIQNLGVLTVSPLAKQDLHDARRTLEDIRGRLEAGSYPESAWLDEAKRLTGLLAQNGPSDRSLANTIVEQTRALGARISAARERTREWTALAEELNQAALLERFEAAYAGIENVLEGRSLPSTPPPNGAEVLTFRTPAVRLARAVLVDLARQPHVHHAVLRLRVHLETFAKDRLRTELTAGGGRFEAILQTAMDSFLFAEGLFPLTHFELSNGSIDTAFEERRHVAQEQAGLLHSPPALIELKQVVKLGSEPTKSELRDAIESGARQAVRYRASLGALWPTNSVYVVVAYDGATIYSTAPSHERLILVYLGGSTPSTTRKVVIDVTLPDF